MHTFEFLWIKCGFGENAVIQPQKGQQRTSSTSNHCSLSPGRCISPQPREPVMLSPGLAAPRGMPMCWGFRGLVPSECFPYKTHSTCRTPVRQVYPCLVHRQDAETFSSCPRNTATEWRWKVSLGFPPVTFKVQILCSQTICHKR